MPNPRSDTSTVTLLIDINSRLPRRPSKIVTQRLVSTVSGGLALRRISLPTVSMHLAAIEANGRKVVARQWHRTR